MIFLWFYSKFQRMKDIPFLTAEESDFAIFFINYFLKMANYFPKKGHLQGSDLLGSILPFDFLIC